jgi:aminopeptidase N
MARTAATELERQEFYSLLGTAESDALTQQALALVFSGEPPATVAPDIVRSASVRHPEAALDFAIANWQKLSAMLEPNSAAQFVPVLTRTSADPKSIDKLQAFGAANVPPGAGQDFRRATARIRYLAKVRTERLPEVDRWVAQQSN